MFPVPSSTAARASTVRHPRSKWDPICQAENRSLVNIESTGSRIVIRFCSTELIISPLGEAIRRILNRDPRTDHPHQDTQRAERCSVQTQEIWSSALRTKAPSDL
jgi:hypothetical protein